MNPQPHRRHSGKAGVSLYATPRELARFLRASAGVPNPVLRRETLAQMLVAQPGTSGTWGLGYTLFTPRIAGHDGGTLPAWGAMLRFDRITGDGMILTVSGGRGAVNQLGHDWIYAQTGVVPRAARRELLYRRALPTLITVVLGAMVLAVVAGKLHRS